MAPGFYFLASFFLLFFWVGGRGGGGGGNYCHSLILMEVVNTANLLNLRYTLKPIQGVDQIF